EAETLLKPALSTIAKMVTQGMLHRNTAARYQSRLHRQFNAL
ncbi:MAG: 30S ribosomal protein S20, partial [Deltaproteobacteria bacterium]|nr:30S ribosomal protein S20 [Deltaproteobacteria bacterium]